MSRQVELDVCHYHGEGRDPFKDIMAAVEEMVSGDSLILRNTFEPLPLYAVLGGQGFTHSATTDMTGTWTIRFKKI